MGREKRLLSRLKAPFPLSVNPPPAPGPEGAPTVGAPTVGALPPPQHLSCPPAVTNSQGEKEPSTPSHIPTSHSQNSCFCLHFHQLPVAHACVCAPTCLRNIFMIKKNYVEILASMEKKEKEEKEKKKEKKSMHIPIS